LSLDTQHKDTSQEHDSFPPPPMETVKVPPLQSMSPSTSRKSKLWVESDDDFLKIATGLLDRQKVHRMPARNAVENTLSVDDIQPFHVALEYRVNCLPTFPQQHETYANKISREVHEAFGITLKNMIIHRYEQGHDNLSSVASPTTLSHSSMTDGSSHARIIRSEYQRSKTELDNSIYPLEPLRSPTSSVATPQIHNLGKYKPPLETNRRESAAQSTGTSDVTTSQSSDYGVTSNRIHTAPEPLPDQSRPGPNYKQYRPPSLQNDRGIITAEEIIVPTRIDIDWNIPTSITSEYQGSFAREKRVNFADDERDSRASSRTRKVSLRKSRRRSFSRERVKETKHLNEPLLNGQHISETPQETKEIEQQGMNSKAEPTKVSNIENEAEQIKKNINKIDKSKASLEQGEKPFEERKALEQAERQSLAETVNEEVATRKEAFKKQEPSSPVQFNRKKLEIPQVIKTSTADQESLAFDHEIMFNASDSQIPQSVLVGEKHDCWSDIERKKRELIQDELKVENQNLQLTRKLKEEILDVESLLEIAASKEEKVAYEAYLEDLNREHAKWNRLLGSNSNLGSLAGISIDGTNQFSTVGATTVTTFQEGKSTNSPRDQSSNLETKHANAQGGSPKSKRKLIAATDQFPDVRKQWKTVNVRAPFTLSEGFQFEARLGDEIFLATVPKGGVMKGELFATRMGDIHGDGKIAAERTRVFKDMDTPPSRWRDELLDCCMHGCDHPFLWNTILCPHVALAQIFARLHVDESGDPVYTIKSRKRICGHVAFTFFLFAIHIGYGCFFLLDPDLDAILIATCPLVGLDLLIFLYFLCMIAKTRRLIREEYGIPELRCQGREDCCLAVFCSCCTIAQMGRHTADYETYRAYCCTDTGLANHIEVKLPSEYLVHAEEPVGDENEIEVTSQSEAQSEYYRI